MARDYSSELAQTLCRVLDESDIIYIFDAEEGRIFYTMNSPKNPRTTECKTLISEDSFSVYATYPLNADSDDSEQMARMAEFICRANYGLRHGNFEFDFRDGEILFKVTVDCEGDGDGEILTSDEIIKTAFRIPISMIRRYSDGILDILFKDASPEDAVKKCEERHRSLSEALSEGSSGLSSELLEMLREAMRSHSSTPDDDDDEEVVEIDDDDDEVVEIDDDDEEVEIEEVDEVDDDTADEFED